MKQGNSQYYLENHDIYFVIEEFNKDKSFYIKGIKYIREEKVKFNCSKCNNEVSTSIRMLHNRRYPGICIDCSRKESIKEKYGVDNISQLKETQEKIILNNIEKYGVSNTTKLKSVQEKMKTTNLKKYGVANGGGSKEAQIKIKKKMLEKYGVECYLQSYECLSNNKSNGFHIKNGKHKTVFDNIIHYHSSEELKFVIACDEAYIKVDNGKRIEYFLNGKKHYYLIDFETDKYVIEIKSSHHWYKAALKSGEVHAKNSAAKLYAESIGKEFLFLLDIKNYNEVINELYNDQS